MLPRQGHVPLPELLVMLLVPSKGAPCTCPRCCSRAQIRPQLQVWRATHSGPCSFLPCELEAHVLYCELIRTKLQNMPHADAAVPAFFVAESCTMQRHKPTAAQPPHQPRCSIYACWQLQTSSAFPALPRRQLAQDFRCKLNVIKGDLAPGLGTAHDEVLLVRRALFVLDKIPC